MSYSIARVSQAVVAGLTLSLAATAVSADALESTFSYSIVESDAAGGEALVERSSVKPGEIIHYQLRHENKTDGEMAGLVIAAPVPEGVSITLGSEQSSIPAVFEVQAEMDPENEGLEWSSLPAVRMIVDADGALVEEPLPESEIGAVRWSLSEALEAGESALNTYRVRVN
ncbi:hypothetical protein [Salipiger aestuarii]|uniref:hypothetical protein n=1 Tax=Salipiger aestuarii TaxID=568098 RepID=UPI00123A7702|nr:hypothetical protein [Salipiger aestuarii]KAA8607530.1 hypothetical protein AL037_18630 [Salipiger aestuarii]